MSSYWVLFFQYLPVKSQVVAPNNKPLEQIPSKIPKEINFHSAKKNHYSVTSNCSNKSFSSIFFALGPFYFFGSLRLGFFLILIEEEMDQWHYLWIRVGQDKMYGVCYDDSSQNNIMTDIDKHSTLLPNPIQHHFWHVVLLLATVPIKCPLTFPFLATFQSSKPAQKNTWCTCDFALGHGNKTYIEIDP